MGKVQERQVLSNVTVVSVISLAAAVVYIYVALIYSAAMFDEHPGRKSQQPYYR